VNGHQDELDFAGTTLLSPKEHARTGDPGTSHAAAATFSRPRAASMMGQLLTVIESSRDGLTAEEAARLCGLDPWGASKRVSDLSAKGLITDAGITRTGTSGKAQTVWKATH
jgi:hypothetical protein